ncbi:MAG TPA: hypothetical protein PKD86_05685 [Gemmatales bacterium]|nr:hypothetical protein [Gemmatales bacterium]HMP58824.1 hypothetical protein [Gemmatales bacterium]
MRRLFTLAAMVGLVGVVGCCHDTCDSCRYDICGSCCGKSSMHHLAPAPAPAPAPVTEQMPTVAPE